MVDVMKLWLHTDAGTQEKFRYDRCPQCSWFGWSHGLQTRVPALNAIASKRVPTAKCRVWILDRGYYPSSLLRCKMLFQFRPHMHERELKHNTRSGLGMNCGGATGSIGPDPFGGISSIYLLKPALRGAVEKALSGHYPFAGVTALLRLHCLVERLSSIGQRAKPGLTMIAGSLICL